MRYAGVEMPYQRTISAKQNKNEISNWLLVPCVQLLFVLKLNVASYVRILTLKHTLQTLSLNLK